MSLRGSEIDPTDLEVGDLAQFEEEYYGACVIEIVKDLSTEDYMKYEAEVLEPIFGPQEKGSTFTFGHSLREEHQNFVNVYTNWKIKEIGSPTDYIKLSEEYEVEDFDEYVKSLKEKYDD